MVPIGFVHNIGRLIPRRGLVLDLSQVLAHVVDLVLQERRMLHFSGIHLAGCAETKAPPSKLAASVLKADECDEHARAKNGYRCVNA